MSNLGFFPSKDLTLDMNYIRNDNALSTLLEKEANYDAAYAHVSNDGTDHSHIDQAVLTTSTPTFAALKTTITTSAVSDPPTDAELDALYTSPATVGAGWTKLVYNSSVLYLVASDGTNWHAVAFAVCV